jgi:arylsulfatase A-like enzyme
MDWLDRPPEKFFMWIDAFDPHEPWDAPAHFLKTYPWNPQGDAVIWPKEGPASFYPQADIENMSTLYRAEVTQIDQWVGSLLGKLRDKRLLDNTAVIFTSDHGTYLGEHNLVGKPVKIGETRAIYEELGHLPMLLRHPEGLGAGKTIRGLGQPPDVFATALDLAGIPRVPWAQGNSLLPRLRGEASPQRFAVGGYHPHKGRTACVTVWTDDWCLIYSPTKGLDASELYHMTSDPTHTHNVIAENRTVAQQLFETLERWLSDLGVSSARRRQLLRDAPFTVWDKLQYKLWLQKNRAAFYMNYRAYGRGG